MSIALFAGLAMLLVAATLPAARAQEGGGSPAAEAGITGMADTINFQGRVLDDTGNSMPAGDYNMRFTLCTDSVCASSVWGPYEYTVAVDGQGLFNVLLTNLGSVNLTGDRWIKIEVCNAAGVSPCEPTSTWDALGPVQPLSSVAVALGNIRRNVQDTTRASTSDGFLLTAWNEGEGGGLVGRSDGDGVGVFGSSSAGTGVAGSSYASEGIGVQGIGYYAVMGEGTYIGVQGNGSGVSGIGVVGSGTLYGVRGSGTGDQGVGIYGSGKFGLGGSGTSVGVSGSGPTGALGIGSTYGVHGQSVDGRGVYGTSNSGTAVYGLGGARGVEGSGTTYGVLGSSTGGIGVYGSGGPTGSYGWGSSYGVHGYSTSGIGVLGGSASGPGVTAYSGSGDVFQGWGGSSTFPGGTKLFYLSTNGYGYAHAGWTSFKEVRSPDGQGTEFRTEHTLKSPEAWSEDFGTAALVGGETTIEIEPLFAQTVSLEAGYHIFLTPLGDCAGLFVASKGSESFVVRELGGGRSNIQFDYRIVARPRGQESGRLEVIPAEQLAPPEAAAAPETTP